MSSTEVTELKRALGEALLGYFNGNATKVKRFSNQLKILGFDMEDAETLKTLGDRSEGLTVLLAHNEFGTLTSVCKAIRHLKGGGDAEAFKNDVVERYKKIPKPIN
jgi:hypothetical protein